jgi:hypothetical protein
MDLIGAFIDLVGAFAVWCAWDQACAAPRPFPRFASVRSHQAMSARKPNSRTKAVHIVLKSTSIRQAAGELPRGAGFPRAYRC